MSDWLHNLPVPWMALVVFGFTYLLAAAIHSGVAVLATGERTKSLRAISPGMLAPLGIIFGLFVAFTAVLRSAAKPAHYGRSWFSPAVLRASPRRNCVV
jgi:hypothetical protein